MIRIDFKGMARVERGACWVRDPVAATTKFKETSGEPRQDPEDGSLSPGGRNFKTITSTKRLYDMMWFWNGRWRVVGDGRLSGSLVCRVRLSDKEKNRLGAKPIRDSVADRRIISVAHVTLRQSTQSITLISK